MTKIVKKISDNKELILMSGVLFAVAVMPHIAHASSTGGSGLPYENWLTKLKQSIEGPVAFGLMLIGIVASGSMLIFGGEISGFLKSLLYVVLVACLLIGAEQLMSWFGAAVIN